MQDADGHRASFLTLIAATGKKDSAEQVHVVGSAKEFTARQSGELYLFVNDWPGGYGECPLWDGNGNMVSETYLNNSGLLEATVWRYDQLQRGEGTTIGTESEFLNLARSK